MGRIFYIYFYKYSQYIYKRYINAFYESSLPSGGGDGGGTTEPTEPDSSNPSDYPWYVSLSNWVQESVGNALSSFGSGLSSVFGPMAEGMQAIADGTVSLPDYIWGKFSTGFQNGLALAQQINDKLTSLLDPLLTKLDVLTNGISGKILGIPGAIFELFQLPLDGLSWLVNSIYELIISLVDTLGNIASYLDPFSENFILKIAFVPSRTDRSELLIEELKEKFGAINSILTTMESLKTYEESGQAPVFKLNFDGSIYGIEGEYTVIDFSFYEQYRPWIHSFTIMVAWVYFIKRLINYLPDIVY